MHQYKKTMKYTSINSKDTCRKKATAIRVCFTDTQCYSIDLGRHEKSLEEMVLEDISQEEVPGEKMGTRGITNKQTHFICELLQ